MIFMFVFLLGSMIGQRNAQKVLVMVRRHGLSHILYYLTLKAIKSVVAFNIMRGFSIERVDPSFLRCPKRYTPMFLPERAIRAFARDPENEMPENFVEEALFKGDKCYGICDGRILASYTWYSVKPTHIRPPDLLLTFNGEYVYQYKGFTHPRFRGQRLHAMGKMMALRHYLSRGYRGLIFYVDSDDFDSLKSNFRMGSVEFGSVYVMKIFGRYLKYHSRGCKRFRFQVKPVPIPGLDRRLDHLLVKPFNWELDFEHYL
jgi:hypothetical protein